LKKLILCLLLSGPAVGQDPGDSGRDRAAMEWFRDAKLGIFIHWGYSAVNGTEISWPLWHGQTSHADYLAQAEGFTAARYDPAAWARLFKETGARYAVLTSKHHDGVAMWETKQSRLNVVEKTPAARDLVGPYCSAMRDAGLKVGLYFSLCDWSHPDYEVPFSRANSPSGEYVTEDYPQKEEEELPSWERFLSYCRAQMRELHELYRPDLWWLDGDWEHSAEEWKAADLRDSLRSWNPGVLINSRLRGYGDYRTPEQDPPLSPPEPPWELCMTMNDTWAYRPSDTSYKSSREIVRIFVECLGGGGNLLLNVGPKPDGTIPEEQVDRLEDLGRWIRKHEEAVYSTVAGLPAGYFYGPSAVADDSLTVYLYLFDIPREFVALKGLRTPVKRIRVVGKEESLNWFVRDSMPWNDIPGIVYMAVPERLLDETVTVLAVELEEPVRWK